MPSKFLLRARLIRHARLEISRQCSLHEFKFFGLVCDNIESLEGHLSIFEKGFA